MFKNDEEFTMTDRNPNTDSVASAVRAPAKRDRPPSSYFEFANPLDVEYELVSPGNHNSTPTTELVSPLFNRKPFKNLSNLMLPNMKKKLISSTKSFTRSMTAVTKSSQSFFLGSNSTSGVIDAVKFLGASSEITNSTSTTTSASKTLTSSTSSTTPTGLGIIVGDSVNINQHSKLHETHDQIHSQNHIQTYSNYESQNENSDAEDIPISPTQSRNRSIRRIHSMCQTTKEKECYKMEDNSHLKNTTISTFSVTNDLLPRIDEDELYKIVNGQYNHFFDEFIIVDCRFNYEYEGGHIVDAINISTKQGLESKFMESDEFSDKFKKRLVVFHCEFSVFRGPTMASHLRRVDRRVNSDRYPYLKYPDIVVLEGGYNSFFSKYEQSCFPRGYVKMKDVNHEKNCENEMHRVRQESKLPRAKSIQFDNEPSDPSLPEFYHMRSHSYTTTSGEKILKRQRSNSKVKTLALPSSSSGLRLARASTFSYDQSIFATPNDSSSPVSSNHGFQSSSSIFVDQDFQPPSTSFRSGGHRKSCSTNLSSSSASISSSLSSICSSDAAFSSVESLPDSFSSPVVEYNEFFDIKSSNLTNYMRRMSTASTPASSTSSTNSSSINNSINTNNTNNTNKTNTNSNATINATKTAAKKPSGSVPALPIKASLSSTNIIIHQNTVNVPITAFKFPSNIKPKNNSRHSLNRLSTGCSVSTSKAITTTPLLLHSSPVISSPLSTATPVSTIDSNAQHTSSIIDPINDTPVDFSVPFFSKTIGGRHINHVRKRSGSLLLSAGGLYNVSSDIDEVDEEQDDLNRSRSKNFGGDSNEENGSGKPTPVSTTFTQKSPFN